MKPEIMIVNDQILYCSQIQSILESEGYHPVIAHDPNQAIDELSAKPFDILLMDMRMSGMNGLELFKLARSIHPQISGIIMTAYGSVSSAVACIKEGISDYIQKPFEPETLIVALEKTVKERRMIQEIRNLRKELNQRYAFGNLIGRNRKILAVFELIERVAPSDVKVFITGETGVGKELVAKAIHFNSARKNKPFVGINCGAIAESLLETELFGHEKGAFTGAFQTRKGKFEYADGGTIFLDEIGDISHHMQIKLLRVLQENKIERVGGNDSVDVNVRVISATNQDILKKVGAGEFRADLYYRVNVLPIHIIPLRERIDDIPLLVTHFMKIFNKTMNKNFRQISLRAMNQLMQHHWPGNVRELENVLERAFITADSDTIDAILLTHDSGIACSDNVTSDVNIDIPFEVSRKAVIVQFEKAYLSEALRRCHGNVSGAAKKTGVNPRTLWRKIKAYHLDRKQ